MASAYAEACSSSCSPRSRPLCNALQSSEQRRSAVRRMPDGSVGGERRCADEGVNRMCPDRPGRRATTRWLRAARLCCPLLAYLTPTPSPLSSGWNPADDVRWIGAEQRVSPTQATCRTSRSFGSTGRGERHGAPSRTTAGPGFRPAPADHCFQAAVSLEFFACDDRFRGCGLQFAFHDDLVFAGGRRQADFTVQDRADQEREESTATS